MSVRGPIVVESRAQNSHISSHLLPLGQVKVLLHISIVKTYECGVRNMANNSRHAWRKEAIRETSVRVLLLSVNDILPRMYSSCSVSDTYCVLLSLPHWGSWWHVSKNERDSLGYRLDGRGTEVLFVAKARDFSLLHNLSGVWGSPCLLFSG
jgi:hypothetical protein